MKNNPKSNPGINFEKYLNCPDCQKSGLYCSEHRSEVEQILTRN